MQSLSAVYKSIARSTSVYAVAVIAGQMSSFLLLPIYTRCLTPEDYGVLELLNLTAFVFSALIGIRLGDALFYYYAAAKSDEDRQRVIATAFCGAVVVGFFGAIAGYLLSPTFSWLNFENTDHASQFHLVFAAFAFSPALELGIAYLRALDRTRTFVRVSLARLGLAIVSNLILLLIFRMGVAGVLWSAVIGNAIMAVFMAGYVFREVKPSFSGRLLVNQIKYAFPLGISGLGMLIIHFGDRFFLKQYVSISDIGIYSLSYKMGMLISYIQMPFDIYWRSQMFTLVRGPSGSRIYTKTCTYLTLGMAGVAVLIGLWIRPILKLMAAPEFAPAAEYVPWITVAYAIRTVGTYFRSVFLLNRRTSQEALVTWISSGVCLLGYIFLIPRFMIWGAVASTFLAFAVMYIVGFIQAQKVQRYHFEYRRMLEVTAIAVAALVVVNLLRMDGFWQQVIVASVLSVAFPLALFAIRFFDSDERAAMHSIWSRAMSYLPSPRGSSPK